MDSKPGDVLELDDTYSIHTPYSILHTFTADHGDPIRSSQVFMPFISGTNDNPYW